MRCPVCGAEYINENARFCNACGAPLGQQGGEAIPSQAQPYMQPQNMQYAPPAQDLAQVGQAMHDYIKVDFDPKLSKVGIAVCIIIGIAISLLSLVDGTFGFLFVGLIVAAIGSLIVWLTYKMNISAAKRLGLFFQRDGEVRVLSEFASSLPFANDQFRLSPHYLFVKNRCAVRILDIAKITRVKESYNFIPTGVRLDALVEDETGVQNVTVCKLHMTKSKNEADEYFNEIMTRQQMAVNEINMMRVQ